MAFCMRSKVTDFHTNSTAKLCVHSTGTCDGDSNRRRRSALVAAMHGRQTGGITGHLTSDTTHDTTGNVANMLRPQCTILQSPPLPTPAHTGTGGLHIRTPAPVRISRMHSSLVLSGSLTMVPELLHALCSSPLYLQGRVSGRGKGKGARGKGENRDTVRWGFWGSRPVNGGCGI